jgi:hypothetical protein
MLGNLLECFRDDGRRLGRLLCQCRQGSQRKDRKKAAHGMFS